MQSNKIFNPLLTMLLLYIFWIIVFIIQKPIFILFNPIENIAIKDWFNVIGHGFKLDFCFSAYFLFIPLLLLCINNFISYNIKKFLYIYNIVLLIINTIIFSVDCILYSYWGFRIDATLLFYLKDFHESLNSVTFKDVLKFILVAVPYFLITFFIYKFVVNKWIYNVKYLLLKNKIFATLLLLLCIPILIICTRGGVSPATANIGMVYYCDNQKLNLAAINPSFNLMYSITKNEDFSKKYKFYDENFCKQEFDKLLYNEKINKESFLTTQRPNIIIVILESFSARLIDACKGHLSIYENKEVTPNLNKLAEQSIVFENAYSNGMRTDRGIVSILSGFLAQPDMTIIKYPEKTRTLPSIAKTLNHNGYNTEMIYGGDINFANMRSYFYGSGYKNVIDFKSFSPSERLSKWGVRDEIMFDYVIKRIKQYDKTKPFFTTFLTLSSHEPFDVNLDKFKNKYVNSVAYTDSCIGIFINQLKNNNLWNNTLVVFVADHASMLPEFLGKDNDDLYRIPILFSGGVVRQPMQINRFINQTDIAKTIFTAMNIYCDDFVYSRDVFNPTTNNYAIYVYTNGFGFIDSTGLTVWDFDANKAIYNGDSLRQIKGKVLLQTLYRDIATR